MALVKGVNCGFLYAGISPTDDPVGTVADFDTYATAIKDTAPTGATKVTEVGWWCDTATEEANFDVGIYDHNVGDNNPEARIGVSANNAKGTDAGWKKVTGLNIAITAGTIYWIAVQLDDTFTKTYSDYTNVGGEKTDRNTKLALEDPWGISSNTWAQIRSIYAVTDATPPVEGGIGGELYVY